MRSKKQEIKFKNLAEISIHLLCPICQEVLRKPAVIHCGHTFCKHCIATWQVNHKICPQCRSKTPKNEQLIKNLVVSQIVDELPVVCIHPDCKWDGKCQDLKNHYKECKYLQGDDQPNIDKDYIVIIEEEDNSHKDSDIEIMEIKEKPTKKLMRNSRKSRTEETDLEEFKQQFSIFNRTQQISEEDDDNEIDDEDDDEISDESSIENESEQEISLSSDNEEVQITQRKSMELIMLDSKQPSHQEIVSSTSPKRQEDQEEGIVLPSGSQKLTSGPNYLLKIQQQSLKKNKQDNYYEKEQNNDQESCIEVEEPKLKVITNLFQLQNSSFKKKIIKRNNESHSSLKQKIQIFEEEEDDDEDNEESGQVNKSQKGQEEEEEQEQEAVSHKQSKQSQSEEKEKEQIEEQRNHEQLPLEPLIKETNSQIQKHDKNKNAEEDENKSDNEVEVDEEEDEEEEEDNNKNDKDYQYKKQELKQRQEEWERDCKNHPVIEILFGSLV